MIGIQRYKTSFLPPIGLYFIFLYVASISIKLYCPSSCICTYITKSTTKEQKFIYLFIYFYVMEASQTPMKFDQNIPFVDHYNGMDTGEFLVDQPTF